MPVLDGLSAIKILREQNYKKPIISLSANVIETDIKEYEEAGVDAVLHKPIVTQELDDILYKYLQYPPMNDKIDSVEEKSVQNGKSINFDKINLESLSKSLSLINKAVIIKLLFSFKKFAEESIENISKEGLSARLLHSIKGTSGNLRFSHIYDLSVAYEEDRENWTEDEEIAKSQEMIVYLHNIIDQIDALNQEEY